MDLPIIDEAERLTLFSVKFLRDRYDRRRVGLLLIRMPGIERSLSRYRSRTSAILAAH